MKNYLAYTSLMFDTPVYRVIVNDKGVVERIEDMDGEPAFKSEWGDYFSIMKARFRRFGFIPEKADEEPAEEPDTEDEDQE